MVAHHHAVTLVTRSLSRMTEVQLFSDIYENILSLLPVISGTSNDESTRTLVRCAQSSSLLRDISYLRHIWRPHYHARWTRCARREETIHKKLSQLYDGDYRLMYAERRRMDAKALTSLNAIIKDRTARALHSGILIDELNEDVWDVLTAEEFDDSKDLFDPSLQQDWLARDYWAKEVYLLFIEYPSSLIPLE